MFQILNPDLLGFPGRSGVKTPPADAGDTRVMGLIPGLGRSPGGEHGSPLQYSCLEDPVDRGAWQATVHGVTKSWTRLKRLSMHAPLSIRPECRNTGLVSKFSFLISSAVELLLSVSGSSEPSRLIQI